MEEIQPRPLTPIQSRPLAAKGQHERDGVNESGRLLRAIVHLAREPETVATRTAFRRLVVKCSREISLDF
jgi:hypothetical protein